MHLNQYFDKAINSDACYIIFIDKLLMYILQLKYINEKYNKNDEL